MKIANEQEVKKIQLEILEYVANFCEKNNINYWLDSGTLIGAIRHKGYIPWDDDIDLGMLRKDFDKFKEEFNKNNIKYKFLTIDLDENFLYAFGKVLDTDTILYEPDEKNGNKLSINIDIFVYDNAPDNKKKLKKKFKVRDRNRLLNDIRNYYKSDKKDIKSFIKNMMYLSLRGFPKNYFMKKLSNNSKIDMDKKCNYVGNFTGYSKFVGEKNIFKSFEMKEFEGKKYKVPIGYDEWLKAQYGDYMKLPPKDQQVTHHSYVAYIKE